MSANYDWTPERLKGASIGVRIGSYEAHPDPMDICAINMKRQYPDMFKFQAISIGDDEGQAFLVPLDESNKETAEYILRAISSYKGDK